MFGNPSTIDACAASAGDFIERRSERAAAAVLVVLLHAAVISLILVSRARLPIEPTSSLAAFNVGTGDDRPRTIHPVRAHRAKAVAPPTPTPTHLPLVDLANSEPVQPSLATPPTADIELAGVAAGAGCDLTPSVQDALRGSGDISRYLPNIPVDRRSIANAIVVWNAGWTNPDAAPGQSAYATIRQTITQTVLAASAKCRSQVQAGPRLIYLPGDAGRTAVLVLGSGNWTWQQVADGTLPPPATLDPAQLAAMRSASMPAYAQAPARADIAAAGETSDLQALLASLVRGRSSAALPYNP